MFNIILKITILNFFFFFSNVYTKISFANIVIISYENYNEEDFNLASIKPSSLGSVAVKYLYRPVSSAGICSTKGSKA